MPARIGTDGRPMTGLLTPQQSDYTHGGNVTGRPMTAAERASMNYSTTKTPEQIAASAATLARKQQEHAARMEAMRTSGPGYEQRQRSEAIQRWMANPQGPHPDQLAQMLQRGFTQGLDGRMIPPAGWTTPQRPQNPNAGQGWQPGSGPPPWMQNLQPSQPAPPPVHPDLVGHTGPMDATQQAQQRAMDLYNSKMAEASRGPTREEAQGLANGAGDTARWLGVSQSDFATQTGINPPGYTSNAHPTPPGFNPNWRPNQTNAPRPLPGQIPPTQVFNPYQSDEDASQQNTFSFSPGPTIKMKPRL